MNKTLVVGEPEVTVEGLEIPVHISPELAETVKRMQAAVEDKIAHLEGIKQAIVIYLLNVKGKRYNRRQMKRVKRLVQQPDLMGDVVRRETFLYEHNGGAWKIAQFETVTPVSGKFELRFQSGFMLTEKQEADVTKLLNYEHNKQPETDTGLRKVLPD